MNDVLINKEKVLEHLEQINQLMFCYDVSLNEIHDENEIKEFDSIVELFDRIINNYR